MNDEWSRLAASTICHWAEMSAESIRMAASSYERPSALYRPRIFIDGDQWCALYGEDLQNGVAGFGNSPEDAMWDFDACWQKPLKVKATGEAV